MRPRKSAESQRLLHLTTSMNSGTLPLLQHDFDNDGLDDDGGELEREKKERRAAKKRRREDAVLRDVLSRADRIAPLAPVAHTPRNDSADAKPPAVTTVAHPALPSGGVDGGGRGDGYDPEVDGPPTLHASGLVEGVKAYHLEAWLAELVLGAPDGASDRVAGRGTTPAGSSAGLSAGVVGVRLGPPGRGFAFIEFTTPAAAARALAALDGTDLLGQPVRLRPARPKQARGQPGRSGAKGGKGEGNGGGRRFGQLSYDDLGARVDAATKARVAASVARGAASREAYLVDKAAKQRAGEAFVACGGVLPGGLGHGFGPQGTPRLHGGYANFEL